MTQGIRDLLASKKFLAALVAVVCWVAAKMGFHLSSTEAMEAISPILTFILSQGVADHGKAAAQAHADAATKLATTTEVQVTSVPAAAPGAAS